MTKLTLSIAATILLGCGSLGAIPAKPGIQTITQPDGTTLRVRLVGDENFHYYISEDDGSILERHGDTFTAKDASTRKMAPANRRRIVPAIVEGTTFPPKGHQKIAVVLVEYQDVKFNLPNPLDYFSRMLNEEGFSDYWATGSARDWFLDSTNGQFDPEFDVFGPITLQKNREYYGGNDAWNQDSAPQKMVIEACRQLNADVDFSEYDRDGDGYIDNVFVVYAGRGEASGGSSDCVWPHAWTLNGAEPGQVYSFDGVRLNRYACTNEWELSDLGRGYRPVGIGSFVHEFSHVMGLPDVYSTSYVEGTYTADAYSAMDYGPYNNDMCTPPQYSAWERYSLGYLTPEKLSGQANIAIDPIENNKAYLIETSNPNEYFLLENRQQNGWDAYIPGHGMLLWHIDYDADIWRQNICNNDPNHPHIDIVEADGVKSHKELAGVPFPGKSGITELSATTSLSNLQTWSGTAPMHVITDIRERGERLVFRLNGGAEDIYAPTGVASSNIIASGFDVCWEPVAGASGYDVDIFTLAPDNESASGPAFYAIGKEDPAKVFVQTLHAGADATSLTIRGLEPSTDYSISVYADDGLYGSAFTQYYNVRTTDPTLDYFAPTALEATEINPEGFTANWQALEGATEYFLNLYSVERSEQTSYECNFDNGCESLPEGWASTSRASYGMSSYAATAAPSLRLSTDADELVFESPVNDLASISFWHRGNGTTSAETLTLQVKDIDGNWTDSASYPIVTEKGGQTIEEKFSPKSVYGFKIIFNRGSKGAVAIDDVIATDFGSEILVEVPEYTDYSTDGDTSLKIGGLTPGKEYHYSVYATDGTYKSKTSDSVRVELPMASSISSTDISSEIHIIGGHIVSQVPFCIYDIAGRLLTEYSANAHIDTKGVYIIRLANGKTYKIAIK